MVWLGARLKGLNCEIIASIEVVASHFTDRFFESATGTSLGDPNKHSLIVYSLIILPIFTLSNKKLLSVARRGK